MLMLRYPDSTKAIMGDIGVGLKPNIARLFTSSTNAMSVLDAGEVVAVVNVSHHIAEGASNPERCKQFINHANARDAQEACCNAVTAGPVHPDAKLTGKGAERVPARGQLTRFDSFKIVPHMPMLADRWNCEVSL